MVFPPILIVAPPRVLEVVGMPKFNGAANRSVGLAEALRDVAKELQCGFYDANAVARVSNVDGVHLDADQHALLGHALADEIHAIESRP